MKTRHKLNIDDGDFEILNRLGKKGSKTIILAEYFRRLLLLPDFKTFVAKTRTDYGVPSNCYPTETRVTEMRQLEEITEAVRKFVISHHWVQSDMTKDLSRYKTLKNLIVNYLLYSDILGNELETAELVFIDDPLKWGVKSAQLTFSANMRKEDVLIFLEKNWHKVKAVQSEMRNTPEKRFKYSSTFKRDVAIYNVHTLVLSGELSRPKNRYAYSATRDHYMALYKRKITENTVKNVVEAMNKDIEVFTGNYGAK